MAADAEIVQSSSAISKVEKTDGLYLRVLRNLISENVLDSSMRILVVCGGVADRNAILQAGFTDFVISNLDEDGAGYLGADEWSFQDAESLSFPDNSFDFTMVHEGLHHCRSPHKAIIEMFRVSKRGILIFEPADNYFTSLGIKLGVGQDYEHAAVFGHNFLSGGIRNSCIPNYIYRFTAGELRKTILCLEPRRKLEIMFRHYLEIPWAALKQKKGGLKRTMVALAQPILFVAHAIMPKILSNQIVAVILKPQDGEGLHPWLVQQGEDVAPNREWFATRFGNQKNGARTARHPG